MTILRLLIEISKLPAAVKVWRNLVGEAYNDGRFFKISAEDSQLWKPLVCSMMDSDKDRVNEILSEYLLVKLLTF